MTALKALAGLCLIAGLAKAAWAQAADPAPAVELAPSDRALLVHFLGEGVVGDPLPGNPIADAEHFFRFDDAAWTFQFTSGDKEGQTETQTFNRLDRDEQGLSGRLAVGSDDIWFVRRDLENNISIVSEQDITDGVMIRYAPPQPLYLSGIEPGDIWTTTVSVKVYDLSHPDDLSHSGELALEYSYLGAYRVTVPAGTFEAALIKWDYRGNVGPANISDTQYRFLVEGIGPVAVVEKKDISAFLIYNKHEKFGKVLLETR